MLSGICGGILLLVKLLMIRIKMIRIRSPIPPRTAIHCHGIEDVGCSSVFCVSKSVAPRSTGSGVGDWYGSRVTTGMVGASVGATASWVVFFVDVVLVVVCTDPWAIGYERVQIDGISDVALSLSITRHAVVYVPVFV